MDGSELMATGQENILTPGQSQLPAAAAAAAKSLQLCLTLCNSIDGSPPGSSVPGILQARILEWVAIAFSSACMHTKSRQWCLTLCNPVDCSPPGSSVHRILYTRILKWVAISFFKISVVDCKIGYKNLPHPKWWNSISIPEFGLAV